MWWRVLAVEPAEFRQLGDEGGRDHRAVAGDVAEQLVALALGGSSAAGDRARPSSGSASSYSSQARWALMRAGTGGRAVPSQRRSSVCMASTCRRASTPAEARATPSGRGRGSGRTASPKRVKEFPRLGGQVAVRQRLAAAFPRLRPG